MHLSGLSLQSFRNYSNKTLLFSKPLTIIYAPNASGKSNLLEAVHFLSTGQSFRSGTVDDVIQIEHEFGRIKGKINNEHESNEIELLLTRGMVNGKRTAKKIFSLNDVRKQQRSVIGLLPTVAFIPEDLRLITGSPSRRREFLNTLSIQLDSTYLSSLTQYEQTLRRRNKLLQQVREGVVSVTTLTYWNQSIIKHGEYLQNFRQNLIAQLNTIEFSHHFFIEYNQSVMSESRLVQYKNAEIAAGHTLVGPHKDDIIVKFQVPSSGEQINKQSRNQENVDTLPIRNHQTLNSDHLSAINLQLSPLSSHGSRGQQRMGVLWLKLGAFSLLKNKLQTAPILLLDDIFSELDAVNRQRVLALTKETQTIMTTAEEEVLELPELKVAEIVRL